MIRILATIAVIAALVLPAESSAQAIAGTGKVGFALSAAGRFRIYTPDYDSGTRQMYRANFIAGLDSAHVHDYNEDALGIATPYLFTGGIADTTAVALFDNSATGIVPDIRVRETVYAWHNDSFIIVKYTVFDTSAVAYPLYLGVTVLPEPSGVSGLETVTYNASKQVAYFFRSGEEPYVGVKLLSGTPYSFHVLDFDTYSPADPTSDVATDSTRWRMTSFPGFDNSLTAGANGSIYTLNAGKRTIRAGDSTSFTVAYLYSTSLAGLLAVSDSAAARYKKAFTSVEEMPRTTPEKFGLNQNFPNPFNPATTIEFQLSAPAQTSLKVYDILGREVASLVNEQLHAGTYRAHFDGSRFASGYYYCRLTAGSFTDTKRMLMVK